MTKRYDEPIDVAAADREWGPAAFVWRGRRYEVDRLLASWRQAIHVRPHPNGAPGTGNSRPGRDAETNGHVDRECFRLLARPEGSLATGDLDADGCMQPVGTGAVYDVYLDSVRDEWRLVRIWD